MFDAVVEAEDHSDPSRLIAEDGSDDDNFEADCIVPGTDEPSLLLPNNDFCFTEEDFLEQRNDMNNATRHQGTYQGVWSEIRAMVGEEVETKSSKDGNIVWKIVESVTDDDFNEIRKKRRLISRSHIILSTTNWKNFLRKIIINCFGVYGQQILKMIFKK